MIWSCVASRTLSNLPRRGNTPYLSRPTTERPLTASALAESPSVRIRVQSSEFFPPASLASSSLGIPVRRVFLAPSCFLSSLLCLKEAQERIFSTMPEVIIFLMTPSDASNLDPKLLARVLSVSLVCESNAGFSMSALTKTHRWFLTCAGLRFLHDFSFFLIFSRILPAISSATALTWVPPFIVQMPLTKETCWNCPESLTVTHTSQRSFTFSKTLGAFSRPSRYRST
mmetsp:Transcript_6709/g.16658  ORF Transcript_6709/g.16658 Transcript_6709/m.16658 type:complete len:228 (+) Transcript_6709:1668-2351(+)